MVAGDVPMSLVGVKVGCGVLGPFVHQQVPHSLPAVSDLPAHGMYGMPAWH